ncbi:hypothetical protein GCM10023079_09800 [Streptomyces chitinivorans]
MSQTVTPGTDNRNPGRGAGSGAGGYAAGFGAVRGALPGAGRRGEPRKRYEGPGLNGRGPSCPPSVSPSPEIPPRFDRQPL